MSMSTIKKTSFSRKRLWHGTKLSQMRNDFFEKSSRVVHYNLDGWEYMDESRKSKGNSYSIT